MKAILTTLCLASLQVFAAPPEADRKAILSMAGTFEVSFSFEEDAALTEKHPVVSKPYRAEALEVVVVAENTPERITLQHLLVVTDRKKEAGTVIKHWAQVWTWQDTDMLEYAGADGIDEWRKIDIAENDAAGTWTQLVTNVDDTPRYESIGKWQHHLGISSWTGSQTRRPLPRREYTKRSDYDYLLCTNTHTITSRGWLHFQDNLKVVDRGEKSVAIAHETGMNRYIGTDSPRATAATEWWNEHHLAWNHIRDFWIRSGENAGKRFSYTSSHEGTGLSKILAKLESSAPSSSEVDDALTPFLQIEN